jgi:hypothetical protein
MITKNICDTNKNVTQMGVCDRKRGLIVIFHMNWFLIASDPKPKKKCLEFRADRLTKSMSSKPGYMKDICFSQIGIRPTKGLGE